MVITTVQPHFAPQLRSLAQDSHLASAVSPDIRGGPRFSGSKKTVLKPPVSLQVFPDLPPGVILPKTTNTGATDYETLKIVAQELLLPCISTIWPQTKPYVVGVQAIWATKEFWNAIADEKVDTTKRTIKGVRAGQKAVDALLTFQGAPSLATNVNLLAGFAVATADKVYVVRANDEQRDKRSPPEVK
ncbi:MAG: hypothetical protein ACRERD_32075 [Candidatus Binatia bacterium]